MHEKKAISYSFYFALQPNIMFYFDHYLHKNSNC